MTGQPPDGLRARRRSDGVLICDRLVEGRSFGQRFRGLMGRAELPEGEGLFLPTSSIHMMFMRFPIDALFLSRPDGAGVRRVVARRDRLQPWKGLVMPVSGAQGVIELPAGTLEAHDVRVGDSVVLERRGAAGTEPSPS